jgi:hypothetical protein
MMEHVERADAEDEESNLLFSSRIV